MGARFDVGDRVTGPDVTNHVSYTGVVVEIIRPLPGDGCGYRYRLVDTNSYYSSGRPIEPIVDDTAEPAAHVFAGSTSTPYANDVQPGDTIRVQIADYAVELDVERVVKFAKDVVLIGEVSNLGLVPDDGYHAHPYGETAECAVRLPIGRIVYVMGRWIS